MGADLRAAFVASCLRGAFPPVDLRAVCFVRAIIAEIQGSFVVGSGGEGVMRWLVAMKCVCVCRGED